MWKEEEEKNKKSAFKSSFASFNTLSRKCVYYKYNAYNEREKNCKRIETMAFFSLLIAYYVIFYCSSFSPIFFLSHPLSVHIFHHIDQQLEVARMNGEKNDCNFSLKWFQTIIRKILKDHYNCTIFIFFSKERKLHLRSDLRESEKN